MGRVISMKQCCGIGVRFVTCGWLVAIVFAVVVCVPVVVSTLPSTALEPWMLDPNLVPEKHTEKGMIYLAPNFWDVLRLPTDAMAVAKRVFKRYVRPSLSEQWNGQSRTSLCVND